MPSAAMWTQIRGFAIEISLRKVPTDVFVLISKFISASKVGLVAQASVGTWHTLAEVSRERQFAKACSVAQVTDLLERAALNLVGKHLSVLPESIGKLTALQKLRLQYIQLTALPGSTGKLTALPELWLEYNQLTELPGSIGKLTAFAKAVPQKQSVGSAAN